MYTMRDKAIEMNAIDQAMKARVQQLCTIHFGHIVMMTTWINQDNNQKAKILRTIKNKFWPALSSKEVFDY